jgi:hypothetical protein
MEPQNYARLKTIQESKCWSLGVTGFDNHWIRISDVDKETGMKIITAIFPCYFAEALTSQHFSSECPSKMTVLLVYILTFYLKWIRTD